jgi:hypothetical protein
MNDLRIIETHFLLIQEEVGFVFYRTGIVLS